MDYLISWYDTYIPVYFFHTDHHSIVQYKKKRKDNDRLFTNISQKAIFSVLTPGLSSSDRQHGNDTAYLFGALSVMTFWGFAR